MLESYRSCPKQRKGQSTDRNNEKTIIGFSRAAPSRTANQNKGKGRKEAHVTIYQVVGI